MKGTERMAETEMLRKMINVPMAMIVNTINGGLVVSNIPGGLRTYIPFVHFSKQDMFVIHPGYDVISLYMRLVPRDWFLVPDRNLNLGAHKGTFLKAIVNWDAFHRAWLERIQNV